MAELPIDDAADAAVPPAATGLEGFVALADLVGLPPGYTDFPGSDLYLQMPPKTGPAYCLLSLLNRTCAEMARLIKQAQSKESN